MDLNTDPFATGLASDADGVTGLGARLMILMPIKDSAKGHSIDPKNRSPWIMWPDTPCEPLTIPIDNAPQ